ncbi:DUF2017 domain-containing protein [Nocardioides caldifontis]|uniref:DUF2017 domain-containing protein n=1 Tax=Nocardioides caldifontis TaxID=2588938 RepID=UPI0011DFF30B|nr:DUF2017 domain-containing protein [Nocardioides caldifontis]
MTEGFQPRRRGGAVATFSGFEADLLRSLASQLIELLRDEAAVPTTEVDPFEALLDFSGPTNEPDDPVLARLFPSAYRDDEEAAGEFRRYTETQLRSGKAATAGALIDTLEEAGLPPQLDEDGLTIDVELDPGQAIAWMKTITDMRLALATRLGIEEGDEELWEQLPDEDPRTQVHDIYDWLAYLQETLVRSMGG